MTKHILILEDDPILGKIAIKAMQQLGFSAELDENGDLYQKHLKNHTPDLILLDIPLPYTSGMEVLEYLRAQPAYAAIPVIVLTADLARVRELETQGQRALLKPVGVNRMQNAVQEALAGSQSV